MTNKTESLAVAALAAARDKIIANMRYLDPAVYALKSEQAKAGDANGRGLMTDGSCLWYIPNDIVRRVRSGLPELTRAYLHVLMHCIFRHYFVSGSVDRRCWDLACDIAAEEVIESLSLGFAESAKADNIRKELLVLKRNAGKLTAERVYRYLLGGQLSSRRFAELAELFHADDHALWYERGLPLVLDEGDGEDQSDSGGEDDSPGEPDGSEGDQGAELDTEPDWEKIADMVKAAIEAGDGQGSGENLLDGLRAMAPGEMDYSTFLRKFTARRESLKVDDSSFDYIFYTYGLELYGDMPLVEPLEYSDDRRITDLVIVIDSSASTEGELVESFVTKTLDILASAEEFGRRFNLRLIQCDAEIQEDVRLATRRDAEDYLRRMKIRGLGGTDFRTAFSYVDGLVRQKEFQNLRGLIYFTDGKGTFPKKKPAYDAAFVFPDEDAAGAVKVPPWAMKAVLD